ncbi:MAG: Transcriptional repressor Mce3R [Acidimicrobiales bacterium]|nr:Transcriptional repressor Mce3R [Acidimicrobiales bacterium]
MAEPATDTTGGDRRNRRALILDAAIELFRRHGFEATGIDDIGAAAGISGPGVYRHFEGKQDILDAAVGYGSERLLVHSEEILGAERAPRDTLDALVRSMVSDVLDEPALVTVLLRERRNLSERGRQAWDRALQTFLAEWVEALRRLMPDVDEAAARTRIWVAMGMVLSAAQYDSEVDRDDMAELLQQMLLGALTAGG